MTKRFSLDDYEVQFDMILQVGAAKNHFHDYLKMSLVSAASVFNK
jgi:hypothetical protein